MGSFTREQQNTGLPRPTGVFRTADDKTDIPAVVVTDGEGVPQGTASNPLSTSTTPSIPTSANILGASVQAAGTIITIPQGRVWQGWLSIAATLVNAANSAGVAATPNIVIAGAGSTPTGILLEVPLNTTTTTATATSGNQVDGSASVYATIAAGGAAAATVSLASGGATAVSGTATGVLL